jgi:protein tyrosine/serine phosphatase
MASFKPAELCVFSIQVPSMRIRASAIAVMLLGLSLAGSTGVLRSQASQRLGGLSNFGYVTDTLYRGAQPSATGFETLQRIGVSIVVNFREEAGETAREKREVEALGMRYVGIPWSGRHTPTDSEVTEFLDLVRNNPHVKIFVHCQRGADRTGTMIAVYRIAVEHKSVPEAVSEMYQFHYAHFWLPGLQKYIAAFPNLLQTDVRFAAYSTGANPRTFRPLSTTGAALPAIQ